MNRKFAAQALIRDVTGGTAPSQGSLLVFDNDWRFRRLIVSDISDFPDVALTGDVGEVQSELDAHEALTTDVHGIVDTALLETTAGATAKANAAQAAAIASAAVALGDHDIDTTNVHGIADTSQIALKNAANTFSLINTFNNDMVVTRLRRDTALGANTSQVEVCGGGAALGSYGARFQVYGNQHVSAPGDVRIQSGALATSAIRFYTGTGGGERGRWEPNGQLNVLIATGTAPFVVASTTMVANLNVERLGGQNSTYHLARANHSGTQGWGTVDKTGSSLADLATRSAGELSSGTLSDDRLSANVARLNNASTQTFIGTIVVQGDFTVQSNFEVEGGLFNGDVIYNGDNNFVGNVGFGGATPRAQAAAITSPSGGATIDTQARTAIDSILSLLSEASGGFGFTA